MLAKTTRRHFSVRRFHRVLVLDLTFLLQVNRLVHVTVFELSVQLFEFLVSFGFHLGNGRVEVDLLGGISPTDGIPQYRIGPRRQVDDAQPDFSRVEGTAAGQNAQCCGQLGILLFNKQSPGGQRLVLGLLTAVQRCHTTQNETHQRDQRRHHSTCHRRLPPRSGVFRVGGEAV